MLLVTLLVIGTSVFYFILEKEDRTWQGRKGEAARFAAETVAAFIQRIQEDLVFVSLLEADILEARPQIMDDLLRQTPALLEMIRLNEKGEVFASAYQDAPLLADLFTIPQSRWFAESKAGRLYLSEVQISSASQPYLIISVPAPDGGVVAGRLRMNVLWDVVAELSFGETGQAYVVNQEGEIVAHTKPEVALVRTTLTERPEMIGLLQAPNQEWNGSYVNFEGVQVVGVTTPVPETDWVVFTEIADAEAFATSRTALLLLGGGMALFGLVVMLVTSRFLGRLILRPMERLRAGTVRIGQGDLNYQIELARQDEVGQVADAFNDMVNRLRDRDTQIAERTQELKESEKRFRQVATSISDHIYMSEFTADGTLINHYLSPNIETLTGYPLEKFITNWSFWPSTVIHPEDRERAAAQTTRFTTGQDSEEEYRLVRADGSIIWVRDNGRVEEDVNSQSILIFGIVSDITERKRHATELSTLLETARAVSSTLDLEEVLKVVAEQMVKVTGVTGCTLSKWDQEADIVTTWLEWRAQSPEYADEPGTAYALADFPSTQTVLEKCQPVTLLANDPNVDPDEAALMREHETVSLLMLPLVVGQQVIGLVELDEEVRERVFSPSEIHLCQALADQVAVAIENARLYDQAQQEITERKRVERVLQQQRAFLQQVIDINPHFVFAKDRDGRFTLANQAFARVYHTTVAELIGKTDADFNPDHELVTYYRRGDLSVLDSLEELFIAEEQVIKADGQVRWRQTIKRPILGEDGEAHQVLGVATDITALKQSQEALTMARDQALEASRFKTQLLANVSHDLRTPLGGILGYTEMLQEGVYGDLSDEQREATTEIIDSAEQLLTFINSLLDQARIEAGKVSINIIPFEPTKLVDEIHSMYGVVTQAKGLELTSEIAPEVSPTLSGDPNWLHQILINLVSNAIKFTEEGGVHVRISLPDETHWAMEVSDTGPGIPTEAQAYIFEAFRQVDGTVTRAHAGSGLGLSIVKQLTVLMGGEITLTSELGRGSTFTILLPLTPIQEKTA
jgi:PAS domain S-box-containing protein